MHRLALTELRARQEVRERRATSQVPLVGPLIAWLRTQWNQAATRWYVLPLVQQQNEFNQRVVSILEDVQAHVSALEANLEAVDSDQVDLARDLAEARYRIIGLQRLMAPRGGKPTTADASPDEG